MHHIISGKEKYHTSWTTSRSFVIWLMAGVFMLMIQVLLGGITRLTGSGLSITEWQPLIGAIPPLDEKSWQLSFEKYQQIAQFKKLNSHFTLADYKSIFFWEWLHREWARLMGLVFIIPFIFFVIRRKIGRDLIVPMVILFLLGGLQGLVGWIMVQSGLNDTATVVSHIRLTIHFMCAMLLLAYMLWFIMRMITPASQKAGDRSLARWSAAIVILLCVQMSYGGLMAGSHAALHAATWPDMNGSCLSSGFFTATEGGNVLLHNPLTIQFIHRNLAYLITLAVFIWFLKAQKAGRNLWLYKFRYLPLALVLLQVFLGVIALLKGMFADLLVYGALHQFVAMLLFGVFIVALYLSRSNEQA